MGFYPLFFCALETLTTSLLHRCWFFSFLRLSLLARCHLQWCRSESGCHVLTVLDWLDMIILPEATVSIIIILYIIDNEYNGAIWECMHGCHLYICILTVLDCLDIILPEVLGLNRHTKHAPLYILTMNGACFVCLFYTGLVTSPSSHRWSSLFLPCEGLHVQEQLHLCSLVRTAGFSYSRDVLFAFISKYNYIN